MEQTSDADSNTLSFSPDQQNSGHGSPLAPESTNRLTARSDDPWSLRPSLPEGINVSRNGEHHHGTEMLVVNSQPNTSPGTRFKLLRPFQDSTLKSSDDMFRHTTIGSNSLQSLTGEKKESKAQGRPGIRRGPLEPETAKHARVIRRKGACWPCRLWKVKVF
jgi:hypothetical protein